MKIKVTTNNPFTKEITFFITDKFNFFIGIKTITYLRYLLNRQYKLFDHSKQYKNRQIRTKGKFEQKVIKKYRFFILTIGWEKIKKYSRRKVYLYFHKHKNKIKHLSFFDKLKKELKEAIR
jgi:hypothetical protein